MLPQKNNISSFFIASPYGFAVDCPLMAKRSCNCANWMSNTFTAISFAQNEVSPISSCETADEEAHWFSPDRSQSTCDQRIDNRCKDAGSGTRVVWAVELFCGWATSNVWK